MSSAPAAIARAVRPATDFIIQVANDLFRYIDDLLAESCMEKIVESVLILQNRVFDLAPLTAMDVDATKLRKIRDLIGTFSCSVESISSGALPPPPKQDNVREVKPASLMCRSPAVKLQSREPPVYIGADRHEGERWHSWSMHF